MGRTAATLNAMSIIDAFDKLPFFVAVAAVLLGIGLVGLFVLENKTSALIAIGLGVFSGLIQVFREFWSSRDTKDTTKPESPEPSTAVVIGSPQPDAETQNKVENMETRPIQPASSDAN